ncbi:MAG: hypothetical protein J2P17_00445 [Mycobacterium sp.]|nr:hypothetical protein [Mycobacterium sp.]
MSQRRFRRTLGGVCSLGLHLVWVLEVQALGRRVAAGCGEVLEQIAVDGAWEKVRRYIEHQWDAVA